MCKLTEEQFDLIWKVIENTKNNVVAASGKRKVTEEVEKGCLSIVDLVLMFAEINNEADKNER